MRMDTAGGLRCESAGTKNMFCQVVFLVQVSTNLLKIGVSEREPKTTAVRRYSSALRRLRVSATLWCILTQKHNQSGIKGLVAMVHI